jgi:protein SCO1/2
VSLGRTAIACACLAIASYTAAHWLTHDFQVWTAEGSRRLEIALQPVPAPAVTVHGPGVPAQTLAALLSASGTPTIVDFMYTRCVSVCTALGSVFQQMQASIVQERDKDGRVPVQLLSITFDPGRDDAGVLAGYAAGLRANRDVWRFARTADAAENQALLDRFQVMVIPDGLGGYEHNAALLVMDPEGRLVRVFDYSEFEVAIAFARSLPPAGAAQ